MVQLNASPAFIGLGSNLGRREANLAEAIERIKSLGLAVVRYSSVYETEPVGYAAQPWFLNQVVEVRPSATDPLKAGSDLQSPAHLLALLLQIERDMGRRRSIPGGPRVIDLDLLLYGDLVIDESLKSPKEMIDAGGGAGDSNSEDSADAIDARRAANRVVIPHPRLHLRRFVLLPLCEIDASIMHPVLGTTCGELLANLEDKSVVQRL
jgi:2-amino-4-hydroxy-6-hydroxymethyldihydropteridine diphosphokinase